MSEQNVNIVENFNVGECSNAEVYEPGTLYNICVKKLVDVCCISDLRKRRYTIKSTKGFKKSLFRKSNDSICNRFTERVKKSSI